MNLLALSMAPLDWGLCGAALLLVIFAARTFVTGQGKAQMGAGFTLVAAVVGTFAIGRQIEGFSTWDGARLSLGVLLLVPVFRVLFTHTGSSVTTAVVSLVLASVIAGPIVARAFPEHVETDVPYEISRVQTSLRTVGEQIEGVEAKRDTAFSLAAKARASFDALGIESSEALAASPEGLEAWGKYKRYRDEIESLGRELEALKARRTSLEDSLAALERGKEHRDALRYADELQQRVEDEVSRRDLRSDAERYADRAELLEDFESMGDAADGK